MSTEHLSESALTARDTSQVLLLNRIAQMYIGDDELFARTHHEVGQTVTEPGKEFSPVLFFGDDAAALLKGLQKAVKMGDPYTSMAAELMLEEHADPEMYEINSIPSKVANENLVIDRQPAYWEKLRPIQAWRAESANVSTGDIQAVEAEENKFRELLAAPAIETVRSDVAANSRVDSDSLVESSDFDAPHDMLLDDAPYHGSQNYR